MQQQRMSAHAQDTTYAGQQRMSAQPKCLHVMRLDVFDPALESRQASCSAWPCKMHLLNASAGPARILPLAMCSMPQQDWHG